MRKTLVVLISSILFAALATAAEFPRLGEPAPSFSLKSQEAKDVALDSFKGKWVVLYFYPRDFTSGCTLEAHNFQRDLEKYDARNAVIVGVSVDSPESHAEFCTKESLDFMLLSDPDGKVSEAYNSAREYEGNKISARNTFLIDPDGNVARVYSQVTPAGHSTEVLAALDELQKK